MTGVAGAVALFSYDRISSSFHRIELEGFPAVRYALNFQREAAEYASAVANLQEARNLHELNVNLEQLNMLRSQLQRTSLWLSSTLASWDIASVLEDSIGRLSGQAATIANLNMRRMATTNMRNHIIEEATVSHRQVMETLAPKLDDATFELALSLNPLGMPGLEAAGSDRDGKLQVHAAAMAALSELRTESYILLGILIEASLSLDAAKLPPIRDRYVASSYRARRALQQLPADGDRAILGPFLDALLRFDAGSIDVFSVRQQELAQIRQIAASSLEMQKVAAVLNYHVQHAVRKADDSAAAAVAASKAVIAKSRMLLLSLSVFSLLLAIAFAWIYVGRGLLTRLSALTDAILALARGNLNVTVPRGGSDELAQIAAAVEVFKRTAVEARDLEADKERARLNDLAQREASFRLLFEGNPVPMWVHDRASLRFLAVNEAAVRHYGYSREQFAAMTVLDIRPEDQREKIREHLRQSGGTSNGEETWQHRRADGSLFEVVVFSTALSYHDAAAALVAIMDVTERKRAEERVAHMARHDALTDLPNRVLFREQLVEALERDRRIACGVAVLALDLDRFKEVNDTLGHPVGDELLKLVSGRLLGSVREGDCVARLGGDEFVIVMQAREDVAAEAEVVAQRLSELLREPFEIEGHRVEIGMTIGIAMSPGDATDPDALLKCADLALYRAKGDGRGGYRFFEVAMDHRLQERRNLEMDLRRAIAEGEFEVHYQPLLNLKRNEVCAFEALLRWTHPVRGPVSPAEFIPLAEDTGLIIAIGEWVLKQACADAVGWPGHIKIAVNLSPVQLRSRTLEQVVVLALATSGLTPSRLELEITETAVLQDEGSTYATLARLHDLGVSIALDDFGTGYSSLGNLRKFPFDKIKIDKSFISDLSSTSAEALAIVRSITQLAATLGIDTTAEGVETEAQRMRAASEGCTEIQGYLVSPALPAAKLARFMQSPVSAVA